MKIRRGLVVRAATVEGQPPREQKVLFFNHGEGKVRWLPYSRLTSCPPPRGYESWDAFDAVHPV